MKKMLLALVLFLAISSYAGNHDKFIGTWKFNIEKFKETKEFKEAVKDPQGAMMMQMMIGMLEKITFISTKTELTAKSPEEAGNQSSTYTIVTDEGNKLEIKIKSTEPDSPEEVIVITFIDDNNIQMDEKVKQPGGMPSMFLIKQE